jgi:hypothetical protein
MERKHAFAAFQFDRAFRQTGGTWRDQLHERRRHGYRANPCHAAFQLPPIRVQRGGDPIHSMPARQLACCRPQLVGNRGAPLPLPSPVFEAACTSSIVSVRFYCAALPLLRRTSRLQNGPTTYATPTSCRLTETSPPVSPEDRPAYLLKEAFQQLWAYNSPSWAGKFLDEWFRQTMRSRIEPMKKIARSLRQHRELILDYFRAQKLMSGRIVEGLKNKG